ncbi:hypothetical protein [Streptomyces violascens]|uniref:Uncharacterized protein n=1 Tax=Streptomyces violascens TaxID=67381 RepID=A0ABQ3QX97_9ACTN|nr:hypothetical protein [Streptomyces violascens]GGU13185.1 hypothetical protein GCM10010289_38560 [Streptomyces violascens]GHI41906.1 hypothetical protein Sviol_63140 [Streptomyces violascens]
MDTDLAARVRTALGLKGNPAIDTAAGETETRLGLWSVRELDHLYARVGGTVTGRLVELPFSEGTFPAIEITITVDLPGVGTAQAFTDWVPADEPYAFALPLLAALPASQLTV